MNQKELLELSDNSSYTTSSLAEFTVLIFRVSFSSFSFRFWFIQCTVGTKKIVSLIFLFFFDWLIDRQIEGITCNNVMTRHRFRPFSFLMAVHLWFSWISSTLSLFYSPFICFYREMLLLMQTILEIWEKYRLMLWLLYNNWRRDHVKSFENSLNFLCKRQEGTAFEMAFFSRNCDRFFWRKNVSLTLFFRTHFYAVGFSCKERGGGSNLRESFFCCKESSKLLKWSLISMNQ